MKRLPGERMTKTGIIGLAEELQEATGATGSELETMTYLAAMIFADTVKDKDAGNYFERRMQAAYAKMQAQQGGTP